MRKVYILLSVLLVNLFWVAACGQAAAPEPAEEPAAEIAAEEETEATDTKGRFALLLSGPKDDGSWNEAGYVAMQALEAQGVEVIFAENVDPADASRILREWADEGYQMIVAHSFGYQDAVFEVAEEYPDTNFAWGGGIDRTASNVADYDQPFYEPSYLVGIIGGHLSQSGKFGAVHGFDIPVCHAMGEALVEGAKTVNPDAELTTVAAGDWYDAAKAKEAALAQADAGVDFWIQCGEGPTLGAIEAAKEVNGYATGYVGEMSDLGPEVVLTSIVWNLEPMFANMLGSTLDGSFDAPYYIYGMKEGALDITINPNLANRIPPEAMTAFEEAKAQILSGELEVPFIPAAGAAPVAAEEAPAAEMTLEGKFALLLSGPKDDGSWNEAGYVAMQALEAQGVEVIFAENVDPADASRILREWADEGYQMIVAHSFGYQDAVFEVAEEYPDTNFAWGGGIDRTASNVADYDQPFYEPSYLVGIIGGHLSQSGKFGAVHGFDIPVCHAMGEALVEGAKTVNPDAELTTVAAGDWYDAAKAKEAALAQADAGVDFWIQCGEGPTLGAIEAAKEVNGYATGYVGEMSDLGPEVVLTSIVWNLEPMFANMLGSTLDGSFDAPYYIYGMKEGALDITINPNLADRIPAEAMTAFEEAKTQILSGELEVPFIPQ